MNFLAVLRDKLAHFDPAAPAAALVVFVFFTIYSIRRWRPTWWLWLERKLPVVDEFDYTAVGNALWNAFQALPAVLLGAVTSAVADGLSLKGALIGAALGALTSVIHKLAAGYKGKVGGPSSTLVLLLAASIAIHATACGLGASLWPSVTKCEPSKAELVSDVTKVLLAGGDYEKTLEQLAITNGGAVVECAVKAAVDSLMGRVGESPANGKAVARGKAFMAKHEVKS